MTENNIVDILQYSDIHTLVREEDNSLAQNETLRNIERLVAKDGSPIVVIPGDLFDRDDSNDAEKKIIYKHISNILKIPTVKELVIMLGNHDLPKEKKVLDSNRGYNPIDTLHEILENVSEEYAKKVTYLKEQKQYVSIYDERLAWLSYSLEDGTSSGSKISQAEIDETKFNICVHHDILKEYVDDSKLPVSNQVYNRLISIDSFRSNFIIGGDIHQNYFKESNNLDNPKIYHYPGSVWEVNYGEGDTVKVRNVAQITKSDKKFIKKHTIDLSTGKPLGCTNLEIDTFIKYITLDLNTTTVPENYLNNSIEALKTINFGKVKTLVKVKMSNAFLSEEKNIISAIMDLPVPSGSEIKIDIRYDKIIPKDKSMSEVVTKMIEESGNSEIKAEDITTSNVSETFENLVLDIDKLKKLFDIQLDLKRNDLLLELGDEELLDTVIDDIRSLFAEQIELAMNSTPNFNITLLDIETNGFMSLDKTKIDLDIPGLTRITGTNGVGKTTLYNMIRWVIEDMVFDNMKSNTKVANSLIIFNDKQPEKDTVIVRQNALVNGTKITITRAATRKWKPKATLNDKSSLNWKKFITGVDRQVKLEVHKDTGNIVKTGEEAESLIKKWFGDVTKTILILDAYKILKMLNMSSEALREMVLSYIGVDYLDIMDSNVDQLKSKFNLQRPKRSKAQIKEELMNKLQVKEVGEQKQKSYESGDKEHELLNQYYLDKDKEIVEELRVLGDIPQLITDNETKISETQNLINTFETKTKKEVTTFEDPMPEVPDNTKDSEEVAKLQEENEKFSPAIKEKDELINAQYQSLYQTVEANITKLKERKKADFEEMEKKFQDDFDNIDADKTGLVSEINLEISNYKDHNNNMRDSLQQEKNDINLKIGQLTEKNKNIQDSIDNGVCEKCLRPFDEHFEDRKPEMLQEILNNQEEITRLSNFLVDVKVTGENGEELNSPGINTKMKTFQDEVDNAYNWLSWINGNNLDKFTDDILTKYLELLKDGINKLRAVNLELSKINENIAAAKEQNVKHFNVELHIKIDSKITELETVKVNINARSFDLLNTLTYPEISEISKILADKNKMDEENKKRNERKSELEGVIEKRNNDYTNALKDYNEKAKDHATKLKEINEYNVSVDEHNSKIIEYNTTLNLAKSNLDLNKVNLPKYDDANSRYTKNSEDSQTQSDVYAAFKLEWENFNKDMLTVDHDIEMLNLEYDNYIAWQKDTAVYNMYAKIIKKDFKTAVFGYYREFLNITLNLLLEESNFKLYWHSDGELYYHELKNGVEHFRPVQVVSGMQTCFLGLSLIYAIHTLNVKHNISHLLIDEISGQLNSGKELIDKTDVINYQEQLILLLSKFTNKSVFIIDHHIPNLYETVTYEVRNKPTGSKYFLIE